MTFSLVLTAVLLSSVPSTTASATGATAGAADPAPLVVSVVPPATDAPSVTPAEGSCAKGERSSIAPSQPTALLFSPVEPICSLSCNDERVFCCADPSESCNYTCAMQYIRCMTDCRLNN